MEISFFLLTRKSILLIRQPINLRIFVFEKQGYTCMSRLLLFSLVAAIAVVATVLVGRKRKRPRRIMREGKLLKSEMVCQDREMFYVEKVSGGSHRTCSQFQTHASR